MSQDNKCTIFVNGVEHEARPGQMLIEVTDTAGAYVPRFCYHSKLSIAANCRMCLVEIENAPKPMPACATPVTPGMKVHTKSAKAIGAQKATMEFLLINHPLDCPICDQGGECELQDLAMGYGRDISRYTERKRVVRDKNIGPLVSTDMTRCIHCTRCVRFTQEIAGYQELGTLGRGDRVEIAPYLDRTVNHELSGNIIDLCPVGALNSKPFRFSARAWELTQHTGIAFHDCLGSNVYLHVMGGTVKRVVPCPNDAINETWLSDRDRFSYEGLYAADRLGQPMIREPAGWRAASWDEALDAVATGLQQAAASGADAVGALVSPNATVEEGYLVHRLLERLDSASIDHRLRRRDFRGQAAEPALPGLGMGVAQVEELGALLVIGSALRHEVPLLAHRVRKAALRGATVSFLGTVKTEYLFATADNVVVSPADLWRETGRLCKAAAAGGGALPKAVKDLLAGVPEPEDWHRRVVAALRDQARSAVWLGHAAQRNPRFAEIHLFATALAQLCNATPGIITEGANAAGLALAGVLPHRGIGGRPRSRVGASAAAIVASPPGAVFVFGAEPEADCADPAAATALRGAAFAVALSPFFTATMREWAHVVLPIAAGPETSGTFVNAAGTWQSFAAAARPVGDARPGWKVLRVLGNRLGVPDCEYSDSQAIRDELRAAVGEVRNAATEIVPLAAPAEARTGPAAPDAGLYGADGIVRRSAPLQLTRDARSDPAALQRSA